jgi:hypothetical protein
MNKYRCAALPLVTCAAGLSLAACSAGITVAASSPAASRSTGSSASPAASASTRPSSPGRTVTVDGLPGTFPIPSGAEVDEDVTDGKTIVILFSSVTPSVVSSFYASALPRAGYTITLNSASSGAYAEITFTGHGYKGSISALSKVPASDVSLGGVSNKNFTGITLNPK